MTVTVRVASPVTPARTATAVPLAVAVATRLSLDAISTCSASPSGSLKWRARSSGAVSRLWSVCAGMGSVATGARLGTVTVKLWEAARPSRSVAVTVTTASPWERAARFSVPSLAETASATMSPLDTAAAQVSGSPSGSEKWSVRSTVSASLL